MNSPCKYSGLACVLFLVMSVGSAAFIQEAVVGQASPIQMLICQLGSTGSEERREARDQLLALGPEALPALVLAVASSNADLRWEAVNLLGELGDVRATDAVLCAATTDSDVHVRWRANWAITRLDDGSVVPRLIAALRAEDPTIAWNAAIALSLFGRIEAVPFLHPGLHADAWRQWEAVNALGRVWNAETAAHLAVLLREGAESIRMEVVLSLGRIGGEVALSALLEMLRDDPSSAVRWRAAMMIPSIGRSTDIPVLEGLLSTETHPLVIEHIERAIAALSTPW